MIDFLLDQLAPFLQTALRMGSPILIATLGGIICEKAGHLNLGVEGMMLMGAITAFMTAYNTNNIFLTLFAAGMAGLVGALIYAFITVTLRANHTVTGLVLSIFGAGYATYIGSTSAVGKSIADKTNVVNAIQDIEIPYLSDIPFIGPVIFGQSIYFYVGIAVAVIMYLYLKKTKAGLNLRMVGENPGAADASGINVALYKYIHILAGGFLCGIAGSFYSIKLVRTWTSGPTAGDGWIAVALIIFATWNPLKAIFGSFFFCVFKGLQFKIQNVALPVIGTIKPQYLEMLPYIMTVVVLVFIAVKKKRENQPPNALGAPYFREER